jgi:hypothetical protein
MSDTSCRRHQAETGKTSRENAFQLNTDGKKPTREKEASNRVCTETKGPVLRCQMLTNQKTGVLQAAVGR